MAGKTILIVDSGGRGAVLVHKYSKSRHVGRIIAIPGNDLMRINSQKDVLTFSEIKTTDISSIIDICKKEKVDLVDVAQDNAIEAGLVDTLSEEGIPSIGPTRNAGRIEWDKAWAREFMWKHKIPHPKFFVFNSKKRAKNFIVQNSKKKYFVKASGLAEGKGALPAQNKKEAFLAIDSMSRFGKAGETFVIEEWLSGEEFSMFAITDGKTFKILGSAQDHKRLYDGDLGPNTGGMGSSSNPLAVNKNIYQQAEDIIRKTISGLTKEGITYRGILYLGAMVVGEKVYVIEFNSRWGDPEAEVLTPGIKNDFYELGEAVHQGKLNKIKLKFDKKARVAVTGSLRMGIETKERRIYGLENVLNLAEAKVYGSRVFIKGGKYFVTSGRLFHIVGEGSTITSAREKAYGAISRLFIEGNSLHYRTDIGWRDLERSLTKP